MLRLAVLLWALIATTLAGTFILAVLAFPGLSGMSMRLIPWAVAAGCLAAVPLAAIVARAMTSPHRTA